MTVGLKANNDNTANIQINGVNVVTMDNTGIIAGVQVVPAGAIMPFAQNTAPAGWLYCNGSPVSRSTYASLFAVLGINYGAGDGSTTFNLPDLRGYFVRGYGTNSDGTASGTFGQKQADELKAHTHNYTQHGGSFGDNSDVVSGGGSTLTYNGPTSSTGGSETRPKNIPMLYCIKF